MLKCLPRAFLGPGRVLLQARLLGPWFEIPPSGQRPWVGSIRTSKPVLKILCRSLVLAACGWLVSAPLGALVEPECPPWSEMVEASRQVLQAPGTQHFSDALEALGGLASNLAAAPLRETMLDLEQRRGLEFVYFPPWHVKTKDELRTFLSHHLQKDYPPEKAFQFESLLKALGFVDADFQYVPFFEELYSGQVAGAYDPESDKFFLVDDVSGRSLRERAISRASKLLSDPVSIVIIHELDHALGGQHFPLREMFRRISTEATLDQQLAVMALVEGDATFVMLDYGQGTPADSAGSLTTVANTDILVDLLLKFPLPLPGMEGLGKAPLFFQRSLIFPYYTGGEFVSYLRQWGDSWDEVNEAYLAPPSSTSSILSPEKYLYFAFEPDIPNLAMLPERFQGWESVVEEVCGEFVLRTFLEQHRVPNFRRVGSGWAGDRVKVYKESNSDSLAFFWVLNWDHPSDVRTFSEQAAPRLPFQVRSEDKRTYLAGGFSPSQFQQLVALMRPSP